MKATFKLLLPNFLHQIVKFIFGSEHLTAKLNDSLICLIISVFLNFFQFISKSIAHSRYFIHTLLSSFSEKFFNHTTSLFLL